MITKKRSLQTVSISAVKEDFFWAFTIITPPIVARPKLANKNLGRKGYFTRLGKSDLLLLSVFGFCYIN